VLIDQRKLSFKKPLVVSERLRGIVNSSLAKFVIPRFTFLLSFMKSTGTKTHLSHWTAIQVIRADEPTRIYELDRSGRLSPWDVPRNSRRTLTDRTKPRTTIETMPCSPSLLTELEDPFALIRFDWDIPSVIAGGALADFDFSKGIDEESAFVLLD
jgi:hypothetical protein